MSGGQPKMYWSGAPLEQADLTKFHTFAAKHKVNTYSENFFQSDDSVSIWSWPPVKFMKSRETQELYPVNY